MAFAFGSAGAASAAGTTSLSVPYPSGIAAGDLLVLVVANKAPTNKPTTPSLWTLQNSPQVLGGSGILATNEGDTYCSVYTTVALGTETGSLAVTITSGNSAGARMFRYTGSGSYSFAQVGGDAEFGWTLAAITEVNPATPLSSLAIAPNDLVLICYASNSARISLTTTALTMAGATFGAATVRSGSPDQFAIGNNCALYVNERAVSTGTVTVSPTAKITNTSQGAEDPSGAIVVFRMRDTGGGGTAHQISAALSGTATLSATAVAAFSADMTLSGTATMSPTANATLAVAAALNGTATLAAAAGATLAISIAMSGTATLAATANATLGASIALNGTATLGPTANASLGVSIALSGTATLVAGAKATFAASSSLGGDAILNASVGGSAFNVSAALGGDSSLSAAANVHMGASVNMSGNGSLSATANIIHWISAALSGDTSVSAHAFLSMAASISLIGTATVTAQAEGGDSSIAIGRAVVVMTSPLVVAAVTSALVTCTID